MEVNGEVVGTVTTGYNSISTGKSVCMALVNIEHSKLDTEVAVRIRKKYSQARLPRNVSTTRTIKNRIVISKQIKNLINL